MRLYEFEAKRVFEREGIPIPEQFGVIRSLGEVDPLDLRFPLFLKSMVLVGGRGKAGGIERASNRKEARAKAESLFQLRIKGFPVEALLLEEMVEERGACYVGATQDPATFNNVVMASASGGVDIEEVARTAPEKILKKEVPGNDPHLPAPLAEELSSFLVKDLEGCQEMKESLSSIISKLYALYQKYDCKVAEINPLLITPKGPVAADAKMVLDDNALFRQSPLFELFGIKEKRHDIAEPTANERKAMEAGFPYVDLLPEGTAKDDEKLYVGLVPGGAGYGIFVLDEVINIGNRFFQGRVVPVNFMDSGGGPTLKRMEEMFHLLMDYELVDLIITSRFGGISSCDIFIRGLVNCIRKRKAEGVRVLPVYGRMVGTDLPKAKEYYEQAKRETPVELDDLHIIVGNRMIMADVIKEGLKKGFEHKDKKS